MSDIQLQRFWHILYIPLFKIMHASSPAWIKWLFFVDKKQAHRYGTMHFTTKGVIWIYSSIILLCHQAIRFLLPCIFAGRINVIHSSITLIVQRQSGILPTGNNKALSMQLMLYLGRRTHQRPDPRHPAEQPDTETFAAWARSAERKQHRHAPINGDSREDECAGVEAENTVQNIVSKAGHSITIISNKSNVTIYFSTDLTRPHMNYASKTSPGKNCITPSHNSHTSHPGANNVALPLN